jgi:hypothetical protein
LIRLLTAAALSLAGLPASAAEKFPARPLVGTFEQASSTPDIAAVDPRKLQSELFQPGQRVRFSYSGEYGSDLPEREVYSVELLPPFQQGFCLRPQWHLSCPTYNGRRPPNENDQPPTGALKYRAYLDVEKLSTAEEVKLLDYFVPYGLKRGSFVYSLSYTDASASYTFYFKDWDTLISHAAYNTDEEGRVVLVDQVLKRVRNP